MADYCDECGLRIDQCEAADGFSYGSNGLVLEYRGEPQVGISHPGLLRELAKWLVIHGYANGNPTD